VRRERVPGVVLVRPFETKPAPFQHAAVRTVGGAKVATGPATGGLSCPQTIRGFGERSGTGLGTLGTTNERESRGATPFPEGGPAY
jgi:hypothetical protein